MQIKPTHRDIQGNHACALGAIAAGCKFFAGYPITPSSEIAERMSIELPRNAGTFIQMEDEIASMGAVIGASMGGIKSMTATSGPGFSLKQENIGYAAGAEIPCVIANVMRGGPSTGMPTRPAQGDIMQARWGTHGDHEVVVLTPDSVPEIFSETIRAFNLSETLRVPVIILFDEVLGHLVETVEMPDADSLDLKTRKFAEGPAQGFLPYCETEDLIPPMPRPGDGYRSHTTGLTHWEDGFPTQVPDQVNRMIRRMAAKMERHREVYESWEAIECDDADVVICAVGISARAARRALKTMRSKGLKVGIFRPITLWPFPAAALQKAVSTAGIVLVPELNAGQMILEVERICAGSRTVVGLNRIDGEHIEPSEIEEKIYELVKQGQ
ncbi:MAG: 2-oxoacid:acceptor oxidoreductase subunit alpha [bacterium]|nr:2-oxoacid:acceptor oxidoreductase subunit alpha [bacterium]